MTNLPKLLLKVLSEQTVCGTLLYKSALGNTSERLEKKENMKNCIGSPMEIVFYCFIKSYLLNYNKIHILIK